MTMTDSPPATDTVAAVPPPAVAGFYNALTTTDHKAIGRLWLRAGIVGLVAAAVLGVLLGLERLDTDAVDIFGGDNAYFQMWALYRIGLVLLVAAPLFVGLAMVVVPMQVGSTNIAFPRAALSAAWSFLLGAAMLVVAVVAGGGWGALDQATVGERDAVALTLVGMGFVIISLLLASICIATTIISLRVNGMTLMRTPLFAWSMLVTCAVWLLTLPVLLANLAIAYVDLHNGPGAFGGLLDGDVGIFDQIAWLVEQPQIYVAAIPALGVLGTIAPVAAGRRHAQHGLAAGLIGFFGLLAIGAWSQPAFQRTLTSVDYDEKFLFIAFGILAIIPILGSLGGAADTVVRGRDNVTGIPSPHLMGAFGAGLLLLAGTAAGVVRVIEPLDLGGRITVSGVMHLVVIASITAALAGLWFWAPKVDGVELSPMFGRLVMSCLILGGLLLGGAQVVNGLFETENFPLTAPTEDAGDALNAVALVGSALVALGVLGLLGAVAGAMRSGGTGDANPWGGHSLEWSTTTPPPTGNFAEAPALVVSEAPLLDAATGDEGEDA